MYLRGQRDCRTRYGALSMVELMWLNNADSLIRIAYHWLSALTVRNGVSPCSLSMAVLIHIAFWLRGEETPNAVSISRRHQHLMYHGTY